MARRAGLDTPLRGYSTSMLLLPIEEPAERASMLIEEPAERSCMPTEEPAERAYMLIE